MILLCQGQIGPLYDSSTRKCQSKSSFAYKTFCRPVLWDKYPTIRRTHNSIKITICVIHHTAIPHGRNNAFSDPNRWRTRIDNDEESQVTNSSHKELIGTLIYLANTVRPDRAFTVGRLSRFCFDVRKIHWTAAKRVVTYLKGTRKMGIEYRKDIREIVGYSHPDFALDLEDRKTSTGLLFNFAGGVVSCRSQNTNDRAVIHAVLRVCGTICSCNGIYVAQED